MNIFILKIKYTQNQRACEAYGSIATRRNSCFAGQSMPYIDGFPLGKIRRADFQDSSAGKSTCQCKPLELIWN